MKKLTRKEKKQIKARLKWLAICNAQETVKPIEERIHFPELNDGSEWVYKSITDYTFCDITSDYSISFRQVLRMYNWETLKLMPKLLINTLKGV